MDLRHKFYRSVGLCGGIVGVLAINAVTAGDMLPVNRALFALDCALIAIWTLLFLLGPEDGDPDAK